MMTRIMLEVFVSKFILYVYQNARWNENTTTPKIPYLKVSYIIK
jgi:hypothetical protein